MYSIADIDITTIHVCKEQQIALGTFLLLLHFSNFPMVEHIEMKLGMYAYFIISMTITCFHDDRVLFDKASGNYQCTRFHCLRTNHKQVRGTNTIYKFLLPEAVCCCLQPCNFCFDELSSWYISVPIHC